MDEWMIISMLAVFLSVMLAVLMIMFSRAFDLRNLEQQAKGELLYAASSVFIVLVLIAIVTQGEQIACEVASTLHAQIYQAAGSPLSPYEFNLICNNANNNPKYDSGKLIELNKVYLKSVKQCSIDIQRILYKIDIPTEIMASVVMDSFMTEISTGWGVKSLAERIKVLTNINAFYLLIYYLIIHILDFVKATALTIFLPLGIVLRSFPPTRGAGAFIIATTIGLYLVFPIAFLATVFLSSGFVICPVPNAPEIPESCGVTEFGSLFETQLWWKAYEGDAILGMKQIENAAAEYIAINICLFPLLTMIIVMSFILSSTNLFGANLPEIGRGLIKLI